MVKLFKFGSVIQTKDAASETSGQKGSFSAGRNSNLCYELATITENEQDRSITTCTTDQRESLVYRSESSMVDIAVLSPGTFMMHYQGKSVFIK